MKTFIATAVQHPPVFLNLPASLDKAETLITQAAAEGAQLIAFGETWLTGYPVWLDEAPGAALWNSDPATAVFRQLFENSVEMGSPEVARLCQASKAANVTLVMGMHERAGGTLYNSILTIGPDGTMLNLHRKLVPTYTERLVWGRGDGSSLNVVESPVGKLGSLVCWEHWMPASRIALHQQQELIHIAQWPTVREMHLVASRHYAFEGQCFVIAAGCVLQKKDLAHLDLPLLQEIPGDGETLLQRGGSAIIAPNGDILAGPLHEQSGFVTAEIDPILAINGRLTLDTTGHYSRPDIFQLHINRQKQNNVINEKNHIETR